MERLVLAFTLIAILIFFVIRVCLLFNRSFNPDEFQHLHNGWMLAQGYVPYRDFWDNHTPLLWAALAPFAIAFDESPAYLFAGRTLILLVTIAVGVMIYRLTHLVCSFYGALFALLLLSLEFYTLDKGIEVRPDQVMILTWLMAGWFLIRPPAAKPGRGGALAGMSLGLGLLFTPKALFAIASLGLALLVPMIGSRESPPPRWRQSLKGLVIFGATALVPLCLAYLALSLSGAGQPFFDQAFFGNARFTRASGLGLRFFKASFILTPVFWACAATGLMLMLRRGFRQQEGPSDRASVIIVVSILGTGLAYFLIIPAPYKQSLLPFLVFLAPAGGILGDRLFQWLDGRQRPRVRMAGALAFLVIFLLGVLRAFIGFSTTLHPLTTTHTEQLEQMKYVLSITTKSDSVLDGQAAYIFRPQASFFGVLVDELRHRFREGTLAYDIPARCGSGQCRVAILDSRMRQMPREVHEFIEQSYSPTSTRDVLVRRTLLDQPPP